MAYKGKHYTVSSAQHLIETIKDFLVTCGWSTVGPSVDLASRQAQDDEHAHILGWFLKSAGEDGQQDIHMHMSPNKGYQGRGIGCDFAYLDGDHTDTLATSFLVDDSSIFVAGGVFKLGAELISVGTVNAGAKTLDGCTRGYGGTTPAMHYDGDVLLELAWGGQGATDTTCARPCIELFAFRDLDNEIAKSSITASLGAAASAGNIAGLDGYEEDKFNYHSLIKIAQTGHADEGKMRWVVDSTNGGTFNYQKFASSPGSINSGDIHIVSGGFFPPATRRAPTPGIAHAHFFGTMYDVPGTLATPMNIWLYGNKDGFLIVYLRGSTYCGLYYGNYTPISSPLTTNIKTGNDALNGNYSIFVDDPYQFTDGAVYRLIGQNVQDWIDNYDRSADTFMGASPNDWDDLDPEELVTELIKVAPGGVNISTGEITFTDPLIYSYKAGAVIGEDPRPFIRPSCGDALSTSFRYQFDGHINSSSAGTDTCSLTPFRAVPYDKSRIQNPTHRQAQRCYTSIINTPFVPWEWYGAYGETYFGNGCWTRLLPCNSTFTLDRNKNRVNQQLPLVPFVVEAGHENSSDDVYYGDRYNHWVRCYGAVPLIRSMYNSMSAAQEDTVKAIWNGKYETFRVFDIANAGWVAVGPEIW
jgi:hypothetical protein